MRRLVRVDGQITDEERGFAFYDTVRDRFDTFNETQVWETADELQADLEAHVQDSARAVVNLGLAAGIVGPAHVKGLQDLAERLVGMARSAGY